MTRRIAVIGAGPSGCYAAERLARETDVQVDVIDRLPVPFGLIRYGVAADHQSTKAISRVLERVLGRPNVGFVGGVAVGSDVTLAELRQCYDAVILATGATVDRRLGIPGEDLPGVVGSGSLALWLNDHPDLASRVPPLAGIRSAVVIGNGNVALDIARLLAKTPAELAASDLGSGVRAALTGAALDEIHVCGRRGPAEAGFSPKELAELGELAAARPVVDGASLPPSEGAPNPAVIDVLRGFADRPRQDRPIRLVFHFHARPVRFEADGRHAVARAIFDTPAGPLTLSTDLVVTAIGYQTAAVDGIGPVGSCLPAPNGRIEHGLFAVGWAQRGPSGTIATNRGHAHAIAEMVLAQTEATPRVGGGLAALLAARNVRTVDLAGWQRIDAAERGRAVPGRPREKFVTIAALRAAAG